MSNAGFWCYFWKKHNMQLVTKMESFHSKIKIGFSTHDCVKQHKGQQKRNDLSSKGSRQSHGIFQRKTYLL